MKGTQNRKCQQFLGEARMMGKRVKVLLDKETTNAKMEKECSIVLKGPKVQTKEGCTQVLFTGQGWTDSQESIVNEFTHHAKVFRSF